MQRQPALLRCVVQKHVQQASSEGVRLLRHRKARRRFWMQRCQTPQPAAARCMCCFRVQVSRCLQIAKNCQIANRARSFRECSRGRDACASHNVSACASFKGTATIVAHVSPLHIRTTVSECCNVMMQAQGRWMMSAFLQSQQRSN